MSFPPEKESEETPEYALRAPDVKVENRRIHATRV
jgi:hypothetical protein